jgi:regulator of nonsense transcripts 2
MHRSLAFLKHGQVSATSTKQVSVQAAVRGSYHNVPALASVLSQLSKYQPEFVNSVVDNILEDMYQHLVAPQMATQQKQLAHARMLAELYNHRVIRHQLLFYALYMQITSGVFPGVRKERGLKRKWSSFTILKLLPMDFVSKQCYDLESFALISCRGSFAEFRCLRNAILSSSKSGKLLSLDCKSALRETQ